MMSVATNNPLEIEIPFNRLETNVKKLLLKKFNLFSEKNPTVSNLTNWRLATEELLFVDQVITPNLLSLGAVLAWIQGEHLLTTKIDQFNLEQISLTAIGQGYLGASLIELGWVKRGVKLLFEAEKRLKNDNDHLAYLFVNLPLFNALSNIQLMEKLKEIAYYSLDIFDNNLKKDTNLEYLVIPAYQYLLYGSDKKKFSKEEQLRIFDMMKNTNHRILKAFYLLTKINEQALKDPKKAISVKKQLFDIIEIYKQIQAKIRIIPIYIRLGNLTAYNEGYHKSLYYFNKIRNDTNNPRTIIHIYGLLEQAWLASNFGFIEESEELYQEILQTGHLEGFLQQKAMTLTGLAKICTSKMKYDEAYKYAKQVIKIINEDDLHSRDRYYRTIIVADILNELGYYSEAKGLLEKIDHETIYNNKLQSLYYHTLGKINLNQHNIGSAKELFEKAFQDVEDDSLKTYIQISLGECSLYEYKLTEEPTHLERAIKYFDNALKGQVFDFPAKIRAKGLRAFSLGIQNQYTEAEKLLEELITETSDLPSTKTFILKLLEKIREKRKSDPDYKLSHPVEIKEVISYLKSAKKLMDIETH